jgi:hypothetical protein
MRGSDTGSMDGVRDRTTGTGGASRIVEHCIVLGRVTAGEARATALARLEGELGNELARRLVGALCGRGRGRALLV